MQPVRSFFALLVAAIVLNTLLTVAGAALSKTWPADARSARMLGAAQNAGRFTIRIPRGFTQQHAIQTSGAMVYTWLSVERKGSDPAMIRIRVHQQEENAPQATVVAAMHRAAAQWKQMNAKKYSGYVQRQMQFGIVRGMTAGRLYYKGAIRSKRGSVEVHGMFYIFQSSHGSAMIQTTDTEPYSKITLPEMEAACLSIRSH